MFVSWKDFCQGNEKEFHLPKINFSIRQVELVVVKCTTAIAQEMMRALADEKTAFSGEITFSNDCRPYLLRKEDGLYSDYTVKEYLTFFCKLQQKSIQQLLKIAKAFFLLELWPQKIKKLNEMQKARIHLARAALVSPDILFIEHSGDFSNRTEAALYSESLEYLVFHGIAVMLFTPNLENALALSETVYLYDENGFRLLEKEPSTVGDIAANDKDSVETVVKISCKKNDQLFFLTPNEIDYFEAVSGNVLAYVNGDSFLTNMTISNLEKKLTKFGFFRCHRSYLVNLQKVRQIVSYSRGSYVLKLGNALAAEVLLSRTKVEALKERLQQ